MVYEYKAIGIHQGSIPIPWKGEKHLVLKQTTDELNKLAKEGWELVTAISAGMSLIKGIYIFRRKLKEKK